MSSVQPAQENHNRWLVAIMGTFLQLCLGTVYAWSFFQKPLMAAYGWNNAQTAWAFSLAICFLGLSAAWGGINLPKFGPRKLASIGGLLFGTGYFLGAAALHLKSLPLLYLGYGCIGGCGLGLGYVTPVATAAKWFPDKKGFVTGMVVMGFGLGALLMSKVFAPMLLSAFSGNLVRVFAVLGALFMALCLIAASFLRNPPQGFVPTGFAPPVQDQKSNLSGHGEEPQSAASFVLSRRFAAMWAIFFCNIVAGISIIGFQSPMLQDLFKKIDPSLSVASLAAYGATLIAVSSLFNGLGRFFWGGLSDKIGRTQTFRIMLASQIGVFALLMFTSKPLFFGLLVCYVLLCYGGGFGTMPSFVLDVFGARMMPVVYGFMLTAWSAAGIAGPQIVAFLKDRYAAGASFYSFGVGGIFLTAGLVISLFAGNHRFVAPKK
jgi:MFS transporter, OFA family, oxalate/formate antiporter